MRIDAAGVRHQRRHAVGVRQRHRERIELELVAGTERFFRRYLQHDRLRRYLDRRHRDLVLVGEVLDRLHGWIAHVEIQRISRHCRHAHDAHVALGFSPQRDQRRCANRAEGHGTCQKAVGDRRRTGQLGPVGLELREPQRLGVFFDQLVVLHPHQRQKAHPILLCDGHFAHFGARAGGGDAQQDRGERYGQTGADMHALLLQNAENLMAPIMPLPPRQPEVRPPLPAVVVQLSFNHFKLWRRH